MIGICTAIILGVMVVIGSTVSFQSAATSESASDSEILGSAADVAVDSGVEESEDSSESIDLSGLTAYQRAKTYKEYLSEYPDAVRPDVEVMIPAESFTSTDMPVEIADAAALGTDGLPAGYEGKAVVTAEKGYIEWEVDVPAAGLYSIELMYYPIPGRGVEAERVIQINGETPFDGADTLVFRRVWADEGPVMVDTAGNEIRPVRLSCQGGRLYFSLTLLATFKSPTCSTSTKDRTQSGSYRMQSRSLSHTLSYASLKTRGHTQRSKPNSRARAID